MKKNDFDITKTWKSDPRWKGIERPYTAAEVDRLRGTVHVEHTLARLGAERSGAPSNVSRSTKAPRAESNPIPPQSGNA